VRNFPIRYIRAFSVTLLLATLFATALSNSTPTYAAGCYFGGDGCYAGLIMPPTFSPSYGAQAYLSVPSHIVLKDNNSYSAMFINTQSFSDANHRHYEETGWFASIFCGYGNGTLSRMWAYIDHNNVAKFYCDLRNAGSGGIFAVQYDQDTNYWFHTFNGMVIGSEPAFLDGGHPDFDYPGYISADYITVFGQTNDIAVQMGGTNTNHAVVNQVGYKDWPGSSSFQPIYYGKQSTFYTGFFPDGSFGCTLICPYTVQADAPPPDNSAAWGMEIWDIFYK
jgi:hypothetical protein